jgi:hypothetical protein
VQSVLRSGSYATFQYYILKFQLHRLHETETCGSKIIKLLTSECLSNLSTEIRQLIKLIHNHSFRENLSDCFRNSSVLNLAIRASERCKLLSSGVE